MTKKKKPKQLKATTKKPRKATSDVVSSLAGRMQNALKGEKGGGLLTSVSAAAWDFLCNLKVRDLQAMAGSLLGQDETPRERRVRK